MASDKLRPMKTKHLIFSKDVESTIVLNDKHVQSNFIGSNIFGIMEFYSRHGI